MADAFILGAGLSYSLTEGKIPLASALLEKMLSNPKVEIIYSKYSKDGGDGIDVLLTKMDIEMNRVDEKEGVKKDKEYLENEIKKLIEGNVSCTEKSKKFAKILRPHSKIFTFNYDLLIENSLGVLDKWSPVNGYRGITYCFPGLSMPENSYGIEFFKLHGGLAFKTHVSFGSTDESVGLNLNDKNFVFLPQIEASFLSNGAPRNGNISYPSYCKSWMLKDMRNIWWEAFEEIKKCDRLFVIGYSFPPEDPMSKFLIDAYWHNLSGKNVKNIYIFDKNSETVANKIKSFYSNSGPIEAYGGDFFENLEKIDSILGDKAE